MAEPTGLRARKKARTRRHIADTAARLFGERGYDAVAVTDVAREAEVAEQTVYNHFPTKESLVLDRDEEIRDRLTHLVRTRGAGISPAAAIRSAILDDLDEMRGMTAEQARGDLAALAATSVTIRRLALEATDRQADALARAIIDTTPALSPTLAKVHAVALAWVLQTIVDETARLRRDHRDPDEIADRLGAVLAEILDDLDRRFALD